MLYLECYILYLVLLQQWSHLYQPFYSLAYLATGDESDGKTEQNLLQQTA